MSLFPEQRKVLRTTMPDPRSGGGTTTTYPQIIHLAGLFKLFVSLQIQPQHSNIKSKNIHGYLENRKGVQNRQGKVLD